jgi:hypothetical protein
VTTTIQMMRETSVAKLDVSIKSDSDHSNEGFGDNSAEENESIVSGTKDDDTQSTGRRRSTRRKTSSSDSVSATTRSTRASRTKTSAVEDVPLTLQDFPLAPISEDKVIDDMPEEQHDSENEETQPEDIDLHEVDDVSAESENRRKGTRAASKKSTVRKASGKKDNEADSATLQVFPISEDGMPEEQLDSEKEETQPEDIDLYEGDDVSAENEK